MALSELATVKIFIADEQVEMRRLIRTSLHALRNVEYSEFKDFYSFRSDIAYSYPDLLIVDAELPGGDVHELVRSIRHNDFGMNPFVPIVAMTWETKRTAIRAIIDSGVDAILLKPLSAKAIVKYVDRLTTNRKSFVVTSSYIGPDRRSDPAREDSAPLIEVPNTLKAKRNGEAVDIVSLHTWINQELETVNTERLRSNAAEIIRLLNQILPDYVKKEVNGQTFKRLERIKAIAGDISNRTQDGDYGHISNLCDNLVELSLSLVSKRLDPPKKDLQLIKPLCDAILAGIDAGSSESEVALEIASSIKGVNS